MAGAKKKGGKKKSNSPKLNETEDERAIRLQVEQMKEVEDKKKREEKRRNGLVERQREEERNSAINRNKIQVRWREILREAKAKELIASIEILSQTHERELDRKHALIDRLMNDIGESSEQMNIAIRDHLATMDQINEIHQQRVNGLENDFETELARLESEFLTEQQDIAMKHNNERNEILDIMSAMEQNFNDAEGESRQEFHAQRDEIKNKNSEEYNVLRITLENLQEELEQKFDKNHQSYLNNTEQKTQKFHELTRMDAASTKEIETQGKKLQKLQENLTHWRTKMTNTQSDAEQRNRALKEETEALSVHFHELKSKMNKFRDNESKRLSQLTLQSNYTIKTLQNKLEITEKIVKMSEINQNLETEREKVLPFYFDKVTLDDDEELKMQYLNQCNKLMESIPVYLRSNLTGRNGYDLKNGGGATDKNNSRNAPQAVNEKGIALEKWNLLDNFYKRYNKALSDKLLLEKQKDGLVEENRNIRRLLQEYLDGISVNGDVLAETNNPLFRITNKTNNSNSTLPLPVGPNGINHVSAATVKINANDVVHNHKLMGFEL